MNRLILLMIAASMGLWAFQTTHKNSRRRLNERPRIASFSSAITTVVRCDRENAAFAPCTAEEVSLQVIVTDPDGDRLTYRYSVTAGKILGTGPSVVWNVKDVVTGSYRAQVIVSDGRGGEAVSELPLVVVDGPRIELVACPCPTITVMCPDETGASGRVAFSAAINGGGLNFTPTYDWTVSSGNIIKGQNTREIVVEMTDIKTESVTGTVHVGGQDPSCDTKASCSVKIKQPSH